MHPVNREIISFGIGPEFGGVSGKVSPSALRSIGRDS